MANQITDNRTSVDPANVATNYVDISGASAGTADSEILYQGTASIGQYLGSSLDGLLYNAGSAQNWSNNTFYILINCGIVGLLDTKALGGFRIRFTGATVTDWFEVYVGGNDSWPTSFAGGWTQFVVDIETARSDAVTNGWTNGTTPATSAIQRVGWAGVTGGTMPRMVDNTWMDEIRRLPDGSAGIIVEGRNGGTTDWTWDDVISNADTGEWGTCRRGPGGSVILNTPIQFGIADTTTHGFTDTNQTILWENQEFVPDDVYEISFLGASGGTTNVTAGLKSGTGNDATGSQGWIIQSASDGPRWSFTADGANLDNIDFYGCSFLHGNDFQIDNSIVECISNTFIDCSTATINNSTFIRNTVVDANTADGVAFLKTDDLTDVKYCNFAFSDGHAIELTTPNTASQTSLGNTFTGYGATGTNDAAIYNNSGSGLVTISVTDGSTSEHTYRNGTSATTAVQGAVTLTINVVDADLAAIQDAQVAIYDSTDTELMNEATTVGGVATESYTGGTPEDVTIRVRKNSPGDNPRYVNVTQPGTIASGTGLTTTIQMQEDTVAT